MRLLDCCVWVIVLVASHSVVAIEHYFAPDTNETPLESEQRPGRELFENRIIGGTQAAQGEFPFFVEWSGCGASLIAPNLLLCAAHCNALPLSYDLVLVGAYVNSNEQGGAQFRSITKRYVHPKFNNVTMMYDYMVLKLDSPVTGITPVRLNSDPNYPVDNQVLTVVGFGVTSTGGSEPNILRKVNVNYINPTSCNNDYGGQLTPSIMLCAGVSGGGKDSCQGDSGGPILDANDMQVGVVSFGYGCAQKGFPGVYSRLSGGIDWINQQICSLSSNPPSSCTPTYTSTTVSIEIDTTYDNYPEETSWGLTTTAGKSVASSANAVGTTPNTMVTTMVNVAPGSYVLQLLDSFGDGFCCSNGNGYYAVYAVLNGSKIKLANGSASFQFSKSVKFTVPSSAPVAPVRPIASPAKSPTPRPVAPSSSSPASCSDSTGAVVVNGISRSCSWLSVRPRLWNAQCTNGKQAYTYCKKICNNC